MSFALLSGLLKITVGVGRGGCFGVFSCCFFSAFFQQFFVYFERIVFFVFGAVGGFCFAADAAGTLSGVGVGAGAVPLELAAAAHYHLDGNAGESKTEKRYGKGGY